MPQIKSNIKSMEKDAARHAVNSQVKSSVHTAIRRTTEAIATGDAEAVKKAFDKAASSTALHRKAFSIKILQPVRNPVWLPK